MAQINKLDLIAWDIEGTLVPKNKIWTTEGKKAMRSFGSILRNEQPVFPLNDGVLEILKKAHTQRIPQGIISGFAYQFFDTIVNGSLARDYIDPQLVELAHKYAWEGMMFDGLKYDDILKSVSKPETVLFDRLKSSLAKRTGMEISPSTCVYIGDNDLDAATTERAGWCYYDVKNLDSLLKTL